MCGYAYTRSKALPKMRCRSSVAKQNSFDIKTLFQQILLSCDFVSQEGLRFVYFEKYTRVTKWLLYVFPYEIVL